MYSNFWQTLSKPFLVLAPMEDVTDVVFREIVANVSLPDVFFTEFTSADGLCSKGKEVTLQKLRYTKYQHPIVAQIWGINPQNLYHAAKLVRDLGFDGVDINMGCPDRAVMKKGAGAAMIKNTTLTKEIIDAVKKGAKTLPVSIKTRIGFDKVETEEWITFLLQQNIQALTIHGRLATQTSKDNANWEEIGKAVKIRNAIFPKTIIIGNGDIKSYNQAQKMSEMYAVDGVMIGRGIFANPWVFEKTNNATTHYKQEYIVLLLKHLRLYQETWGDTKSFHIMKKFFKMYINNFRGANELRQKLMECTTRAEAEAILSS